MNCLLEPISSCQLGPGGRENSLGKTYRTYLDFPLIHKPLNKLRTNPRGRRPPRPGWSSPGRSFESNIWQELHQPSRLSSIKIPIPLSLEISQKPMVATLAGYTRVSLSYVTRTKITKVWLRYVFLGYMQHFFCKDYE